MLRRALCSLPRTAWAVHCAGAVTAVECCSCQQAAASGLHMHPVPQQQQHGCLGSLQQGHWLVKHAVSARSFTSTAGALGSVVSFPLAQTGEGISECELMQWFVKVGGCVDTPVLQPPTCYFLGPGGLLLIKAIHRTTPHWDADVVRMFGH